MAAEEAGRAGVVQIRGVRSSGCSPQIRGAYWQLDAFPPDDASQASISSRVGRTVQSLAQLRRTALASRPE